MTTLKGHFWNTQVNRITANFGSKGLTWTTGFQIGPVLSENTAAIMCKNQLQCYPLGALLPIDTLPQVLVFATYSLRLCSLIMEWILTER